MDSGSRIGLHTGRQMPVLGLGTWQLREEPIGIIRQALELGYRMIDTSGDYGSQRAIGQACRESEISRDELYIVSKVEETDDAYEATVKNLAELGMDYADLMLIHRPPGEDDPGLELWKGLQRARDEGLTRDIGVSNYSIKLLRILAEIGGELPVVNQLEWSPFGHSEDMFGYCSDNGIIIQAYSPLTRTERLHEELIADMAASYQRSPAQLFIRWNLQMGVVPLPKADRPEHLRENIEVFDFDISDDDMATLNGLNERYSALGSLPYE